VVPVDSTLFVGLDDELDGVVVAVVVASSSQDLIRMDHQCCQQKHRSSMSVQSL